MKRKTTANMVLPKAGLNGFDWAFVQGSTFVLRLNFCAKNPRLRQYPNRWQQLIETPQLMKVPFTLLGEYKSSLTFDEIKKALENDETKKYFSGLQVDKYSCEILGSSIKIQRYSYGLDIFIASFPLITGEIKSQNPTLLSLKFKPNYFSILFFSFFVVMFISLGIFSDRDNLGFSPTDSEALKRILHLVAGIVPGIWCYLRYIRPIKKTEHWIKEKLSLSQL